MMRMLQGSVEHCHAIDKAAQKLGGDGHLDEHFVEDGCMHLHCLSFTCALTDFYGALPAAFFGS